MTDARYAPPTTVVADVERTRGPRPHVVTAAVRLLWGSFPLGVPVLLHASLELENVAVRIVSIIFYVIALTLSALLFVIIGRGRNWARILLLVLTVISLPALLLPDLTPPDPLYVRVANLVAGVLGIIATVLLFTRPASAWFRGRSSREV